MSVRVTRVISLHLNEVYGQSVSGRVATLSLRSHMFAGVLDYPYLPESASGKPLRPKPLT